MVVDYVFSTHKELASNRQKGRKMLRKLGRQKKKTQTDWKEGGQEVAKEGKERWSEYIHYQKI